MRHIIQARDSILRLLNDPAEADGVFSAFFIFGHGGSGGSRQGQRVNGQNAVYRDLFAFDLHFHSFNDQILQEDLIHFAQGLQDFFGVDDQLVQDALFAVDDDFREILRGRVHEHIIGKQAVGLVNRSLFNLAVRHRHFRHGQVSARVPEIDFHAGFIFQVIAEDAAFRGVGVHRQPVAAPVHQIDGQQVIRRGDPLGHPGFRVQRTGQVHLVVEEPIVFHGVGNLHFGNGIRRGDVHVDQILALAGVDGNRASGRCAFLFGGGIPLFAHRNGVVATAGINRYALYLVSQLHIDGIVALFGGNGHDALHVLFRRHSNFIVTAAGVHTDRGNAFADFHSRRIAAVCFPFGGGGGIDAQAAFRFLHLDGNRIVARAGGNLNLIGGCGVVDSQLQGVVARAGVSRYRGACFFDGHFRGICAGLHGQGNLSRRFRNLRRRFIVARAGIQCNASFYFLRIQRDGVVPLAGGNGQFSAGVPGQLQ